MALQAASFCLQEKVLPFMSVSQAVTIPEEEPSPLDEVEEELRRLHLERRTVADCAERPMDGVGHAPEQGLESITEAEEPPEPVPGARQSLGASEGLHHMKMSQKPYISTVWMVVPGYTLKDR